MDIYVGFDPGGDGRFGWAACSYEANVLRLIAAGKAHNAKEAISQTLSALSTKDVILGAGIDAPLFWTVDGGRNVDDLVRRAIQQLGARTPGGTVQHFNSLRGACLVQGVLTAKLLHDLLPQVAITESHPKVLPPMLNGPILFDLVVPVKVAGLRYEGSTSPILGLFKGTARGGQKGTDYFLAFSCCDSCSRQDGPSMLMMME